jgi:hypothetical protein
MLYRILTRTRVALLLAVLVFTTCSDDDQTNKTNTPNTPGPNNPDNPDNPSNPTTVHYTKGWVLDVKEHIDIDIEEMGPLFYLPLDCAPLKNGAIAISAWEAINSRLLEVNAETGAVQNKIGPPAWNAYIEGLVLRDDGSIQVRWGDDTWQMGIYNQENHLIESSIEIDLREISLNTMTSYSTLTSDHHFYIFGGLGRIWTLMKWGVDGKLLSQKKIDQTTDWEAAAGAESPFRETYTFWPHDDYSWVLTSAKNHTGGLTMLYKLTQDGTVQFAKKFPTPGEDLYLIALQGNAEGEVFFANHTELRKLDRDGNELWKKTVPVGPMENSFIELKATQDGGVLLCYGDGGRAMLARLDANGNKTWEAEHWEKNLRAQPHELPSGDLLVTSIKGVATKYTLDRD